MPNHVDLLTAEVHDPKGAVQALENQVYVSNGSNGGSFVIGPAFITFTMTLPNISDVASKAFLIHPIAFTSGDTTTGNSAGVIAPFFGMLQGVIATANATVTLKNFTTSKTLATWTVPFSGSAAGDLVTGVPTTVRTDFVWDTDDVLILETDGASTNAVEFIVTVISNQAYIS